MKPGTSRAPPRSMRSSASGALARPAPDAAITGPSNSTQASGTSPSSSMRWAECSSVVVIGRSFEDDRAGAVEQHAMLREPLDGLGEGAGFLVLPDRDQLGCAARMVHAHDVLLDDRALVEIARDEVRRRADELHPPGVRL